MKVEDPTLLEPIEIKTLDEARAALNRPRGSFEEWLDCARIFSKLNMWDELEKASIRALESAIRRPLKQGMLKEAAERFAAGALKEPRNLDDLQRNCKEASEALNEFTTLLNENSARLKSYFDSVIEALDEITLLLTEGSPQALTAISSRLRKRLGRADLAITVATVAIKNDPQQYAAFTTRGAAHSELSHYDQALTDFLFAEDDAQSRPFAIAGHTKLLIRQSEFRAAMEIGWELLKTGSKRKTILFLLAAAAKGAGEEEKFKWLVNEAEALPDVVAGSGRVLLTKQAIRILIENKQFDVAEKLLGQYATMVSGPRFITLQKELTDARMFDSKLQQPLQIVPANA